MSFNRRPSPLQLLFAATLGVALVSAAPAQDTIRQTNGATQQGLITRMTKGAVVIKIGAGELGVPLSQIAQVIKAEPPTLARGMSLQENGKAAEAVALIKPVVDQFGGLPTEWARAATAALGDLYLAQNKIAEAGAAYQNFKLLYPGAGLSLGADVGMARIAAATGKTAEAQKVLDPLLTSALGKTDLTKAESIAFGQTCFTLGNIEEKEGKFAEALQNYLRTVTIFYADRSIVAQAQERADAIRKEQHVAVP